MKHGNNINKFGREEKKGSVEIKGRQPEARKEKQACIARWVNKSEIQKPRKK